MMTRLYGKHDDKNPDMEEEEAEFLWEISRDWNAKYYRRSHVILVKNAPDIIDGIANHRKRFEHEGEFLVLWRNGERTWSIISNVHEDNKNMVKKYLKAVKLSIEDMSMGLDAEQKKMFKKMNKKAKKTKPKNLKKGTFEKFLPNDIT